MHSIEPNPILKSIEKIANAFKNSELSDQNRRRIFNSLKDEIKTVSTFLHCTEDEAWLFSVMFAMSISGKESDMDGLTNYLNCNPFFIVSLSPILDSLVSKRLLIKNSGYDLKVIATRFHVSSYVFNAISLNKSVSKTNKFEDVYEVIERINEMICERERNNLSTEDLFMEVFGILEKEKRFSLIRKVLEGKFSEDDTLLLIYLCFAYANDSNEADIERYIYYVYDSMGSKIRAKKNLFAGHSRLIDEELVSFIEESFYGGKELALTDKAIEHFFEEDLGVGDKNKIFSPKYCTQFLPDKIKTCKLFFNQEEGLQISFLEKLLEEENYQKAIQKFANLKFPAGITALFYGEPGTGKTQIAYNLAQKTGRVLLMVDIAAIRDKYVGESEKRIKQIFKTYQQAKNHYEIAPILFFNESDALISKRYEVATSVDQMNNSMQNILLQELEDFEGILIATSNMNENLDAAFERRFLYKIHFEKPESAIGKQIWTEKMPQLNPEEINLLVQEYQLTGGQIHNISRKYILSHILNDTSPNIKDILDLCDLEYFGKSKGNRLGFKGN